MRHEPEHDAARFLGGGMSRQDRESFSAHLLHCAQCWAEVSRPDAAGRWPSRSVRQHP